MKNTYILFAFILLLNNSSLRAQQHASVGDTIKVEIAKNYRGNLQWQSSFDSINWNNITGGTDTNLTYVVSQIPSYLRTSVAEGSCNPVYSNRASIKNIVTVSPTISNPNDSLTITVYEDTSLAGKEMALQAIYKFKYSNAKAYFFGSFDSLGSPFQTKEAIYTNAGGDTSMNIKFDDELRAKAVFFTFNGQKDTTLLTYNYSNDSTLLSSYYVDWSNDSLKLRSKTNLLGDTSGFTVLNHVSFKNRDAVWAAQALGLGVCIVTIAGIAKAVCSMVPPTPYSVVICGLSVVADLYLIFGGQNAAAATISSANLPPTQIHHPFEDPNNGTVLDVDDNCPMIYHSIVTDIDGNVYTTVKIGCQIWIAENLRTKRYTNGDLITQLNNSNWTYATGGAWAYYNNDSAYNRPYGKLYNGKTIYDARGVCPVGWHVPKDSDWVVLGLYLGLDSATADGIAQNVGGKLKESGTSHWASPNTGATNQYGFSAVGGGAVNFVGGYNGINSSGLYWTSTLNPAGTNYYTRQFSSATSGFYRGTGAGNEGASIRCVKD